MSLRYFARAFFALLIAALATVAGGEDAPKRPPFQPFKPSYRSGESYIYSVYWKGIKIGQMSFWTNTEIKQDEPVELHFQAKSNRLGKWLYGYFRSDCRCMQDISDGSTLSFYRYLDWDESFLEEDLKYDYPKMEVRQSFRTDKHREPSINYRLIPGKMMDPITLFQSFRFRKITEIGETRAMDLYAAGLWTASVKVTGKTSAEIEGIGRREVWIASVNLPSTGVLYETGDFALEIDVQTGIIVQAEWNGTRGACRAALVKADNSPLPNPEKAD
ncbi:MAG: DUF3108 domain-containing protein [Candidatus Brocadiia bacterium]